MHMTSLRYRPFGLFRTILALLVIVQHVGHVGPDGMEWGRWATGSIAVLAFFSLSGFVVSEAVAIFYTGRPFQFAMNRALRILPQYFVALIFSVFAVMASLIFNPALLPNALIEFSSAELFSSGNLIANLVNVMPGSSAKPFVPYAWALKVEVAFYIVLAASILLPARNLVLLGIACAVFVAFLSGRGPSSFGYAPYFAFGAVSYVAAASGAVRARILQAILLGVCLIVGMSISLPEFYEGRPPFSRLESVAHLSILTASLAAPVILAQVNVSRRAAALDRRIGDLSFPLYLQQYAILVLAYAFLPRSYWTVAWVFAAALLAALVSDRLLEAPLRRARDVIRGRSLSLSAKS